MLWILNLSIEVKTCTSLLLWTFSTHRYLNTSLSFASTYTNRCRRYRHYFQAQYRFRSWRRLLQIKEALDWETQEARY